MPNVGLPTQFPFTIAVPVVHEGVNLGRDNVGQGVGVGKLRVSVDQDNVGVGKGRQVNLGWGVGVGKGRRLGGSVAGVVFGSLAFISA